jgi:hypothetical protein
MKWILFFSLASLSPVFSQETWQEVSRTPIKSDQIWKMDLLGNLLIADKDVLVKYDTTGVKRFSQSIKSLGRIHQIAAINIMKTLLFSEEQQTFTIIDNTLSEANKTYDLSTLGFGYVSQIATSAQPNKVWIYDQLNSKLVLLDLSKSSQRQEIENLRGLLNSKEIKWIEERDSRLYMRDVGESLYVFDLYGSLIDLIKVGSCDQVILKDQGLYLLDKGSLYYFDVENNKRVEVRLPLATLEKLEWVNQIVFIQSEGKLIKYRTNF